MIRPTHHPYFNERDIKIFKLLAKDIESGKNKYTSTKALKDIIKSINIPLVADIQNTGNLWVLYGTGGENYGGSFYAALLDDLILGDLSASIILDSDPNKGYIAPAAIHQNSSGFYDFIIQSYDGLVTKIDGQTFMPIWTYQKPGTESSAEPVIGNFTGDLTPCFLGLWFNGMF
mgnify:CR=1 FL=1